MVIWIEKRRYKSGKEVQFEFKDGEHVCVKALFGKKRYGTILSHNCGINGRDGYYANYKIQLDDGPIRDFREEELGREVLR